MPKTTLYRGFIQLLALAYSKTHTRCKTPPISKTKGKLETRLVSGRAFSEKTTENGHNFCNKKSDFYYTPMV